MPRKVLLSGAEKRRLLKDRALKHAASTKSMSRLDNFLMPKHKSEALPQAHPQAIDNDAADANAMPTASSVTESIAHNVNNPDNIFPTAAVPMASVSGDTSSS